MKPRVIFFVSSSGDSGSPAFVTLHFSFYSALIFFALHLRWKCNLGETFSKRGEHEIELGAVVAHSKLDQA